MLVHLSEILEEDPKGTLPRLAPVLNDTFHYVGSAITGALAQAPVDRFDLVLTNPPYVVKGTGVQRDALRQDSALADYYSVPGAGIENLFVQMVIHGLKPGARALLIVPDGLLLRHSEARLRAHLLHTCILEAIVSLPKNAFYSTPKKTYILVFRKKQHEHDKRNFPVFTYLATNIGETLDAKRFTIEENDLPPMAAAFKLFQGNPVDFQANDLRVKVWPIEKFRPEDHWMVEKWWTSEERERLGDLDKQEFVGTDDLAIRLKETALAISLLGDNLNVIEHPGGSTRRTVTVSLGDMSLFRMSIGKRVVMKTLFYGSGGAIPLYSANVEEGEEHGWIQESNLTDFSHPSLLWSIDSDFNMTVRAAGELFATTDHCGRLETLDSALDPSYCRAAITYGFGRVFGFDRVHRPSLKRMRAVTFRVPIKEDGTFDLAAQRGLAKGFDMIGEALKQTADRLRFLADVKPKIDLPENAADIGLRKPLQETRKESKRRVNADEDVYRQRATPKLRSVRRRLAVTKKK